jgi:Domain of unknown function (DUF4345)
MLLMEIILRILLGLVTLICFAGGLNLLIKGAGSFLPITFEPQPILDNLFRFLSGIYFGMGFLMSWIVFHLQEENSLVYFVGLVVVFSGLGRLYSRIRVGPAGKYFDTMMVVEIVLGLCIILLQFLRN